MKTLSPEARLLVEQTRDGDAPSAADAARVRAALAARIAASATVTAGVVGATYASKAGSATAASAATGAAGASADVGATSLAAGGKLVVSGMATTAGVFGKVVAAVIVASAISATVALTAPRMSRSMRHVIPAPVSTAGQTGPVVAARTPLLSLAPTTEPPAAAAAPVEAHLEIPPVITKAVEHRPDRSATANSKVVTPTSSAVDPAPTGQPRLDVGAEAKLIDAAAKALHNGDSVGALDLLRDHAARFPAGALAEERDAARVLALRAAGRTGEACVEAAAFLSAYAQSPHRARVALVCGSVEAPIR